MFPRLLLNRYITAWLHPINGAPHTTPPDVYNSTVITAITRTAVTPVIEIVTYSV